MVEPLFFDNSTAKAVAECSTKALVRYGFGYTSIEEAAALKQGSAGHEALAVWFRGGSRAEALSTYETEYRAWAEEHVLPDDRLGWENSSRVLAAWLDQHPMSSFDFAVQPEMVEVGFCYPLSEEEQIFLTGRIDAIVVAPDGGWYILDHKFTGAINARWVKQFQMASGLSGYIWAAQHFTEKPVVGAYINGIEMAKQPSDPVRKCKTHGVVYAECGTLHNNSKLLSDQRSPEQLAEWKKSALHLARKFRELTTRYPDLAHINKVRMQGTFSNACQWCEFQPWCVTGRQPQLAASMLVYERWDPLAYSQKLIGTSGHKP